MMTVSLLRHLLLQVLGLFNRSMRKLTSHLSEIEKSAVEEELAPTLGGEHAADDVQLRPLEQGLDNELVCRARSACW